MTCVEDGLSVVVVVVVVVVAVLVSCLVLPAPVDDCGLEIEEEDSISLWAINGSLLLSAG